MRQSKLFSQSRWRLASWYAGVMGVILSLCGLAFYQMMAHAHQQTLHQELESVAGTLHDGLEPNLQQPGQINVKVSELLPGLCLVGSVCPQSAASERHILGVLQQTGYYAHFLTQSGQLVATVGQQPAGLPIRLEAGTWQTLQNSSGDRYHQITVPLKTANHQFWGYLQVGRSMQDFDRHLADTILVLLIGIPISLILVCVASWWLAGLAMQPVYQSYQQMQQFTADAAHELRTPLAAIQATLESVLELPKLPEPEARNALQIVERQNRRLVQLVQDLLFLTRMNLKVLPLQRQPCCLQTLIHDLVDEFEAMAIAAELSLNVDLRSQLPLFVLGDEEQLYRLLANLVTNALQYTPPGGQILVSLTCKDDLALIQVQDNGIGIASAEQSRIFDRFYRVSGDRSRRTGGAGLGLAIAQEIALAHQAKLQVESQLNQGSKFTICLPLEKI
jgi:signal transduction histidine kinase